MGGVTVHSVAVQTEEEHRPVDISRRTLREQQMIQRLQSNERATVEWLLEKIRGLEDTVREMESFRQSCLETKRCLIALLENIYDCRAVCE